MSKIVNIAGPRFHARFRFFLLVTSVSTALHCLWNVAFQTFRLWIRHFVSIFSYSDQTIHYLCLKTSRLLKSEEHSDTGYNRMSCKNLLTSLHIRRTSSLHNANVQHVHLSPQILDYDLFTPTVAPKANSKMPPMIFLHGLLGNRKNNRSAAKLLAEQLQTQFIVPDLRNHGTSFHAVPMNNKSMSDDITKLIDSLPSTVPRHRGFVIMGHSMGAKVAMIHALRFPKLIKGVVSIDNVPYDNSEDSYVEFEKFHIGLRTLDWCVKTHPDWSLPDMKAYLMKWVEPSEKVINFWLTNVVNKNGLLVPKVPFNTLNESIEDIMQWKMQEYGDLESLAGQKAVAPLLLISANYSKFVGKDVHTHAISKYFQDFIVKPVDSGHWVVTERKQEFTKIVREWALSKFGS